MNMKRLFLLAVILGLTAGGARAGVVLGTDHPAGSPLSMAAGSISGNMFVNVVSNVPNGDVMSAWNLGLVIVPNNGATGTVSFNDPVTGTPPNPISYVFGANGLGISATNSGTTLTANDFFDPSVGPGAVVPGGAGANLIRLDFVASSNASGLFGVYAVRGAANTEWSDAAPSTQFFTNVPDGTGTVLIGDVLIAATVVPEPSPHALIGLFVSALVSWRWRRGLSAQL